MDMFRQPRKMVQATAVSQFYRKGAAGSLICKLLGVD